MPFNSGKRPIEHLISSAENALGRIVRVVDKDGRLIGSGSIGHKVPERAFTKDNYRLYIEGSQGLDFIASSDSLTEIKVYLMGLETGAAYRR